ncbi:retrovirus-related Pol polyprotein from transposon opus [Trichonephila clavipes]|nr:retrovirus-related Pol polyprotein from transposon opus [Trichonephila clavipes]
MAFLGRALKADLKCLAEELGETVTEEMKVPALKKLIVASKEYEEVFTKEFLHRIVTERENEIQRQEREGELKSQERDELKRQEREDEIKRQEREDELEKLKIEASMMSNCLKKERNSQNEEIQEHVPDGLQKLMRTFDPKEGDISFYLIHFERQARRVHIKEEDWVTNCVGLLPLEMANLIAREPEKKANDYEHIKEQMKEQVSRDIQQHFIDDWSRIVTVDDLTEKLDDYENVSEVQVAEVKVVEDESKVVTARFNGEVVKENKCSAVQLKMSDLKIVKISYGGTEYEAVVDSGAQISVFKSSVVGKEVDYKGHIMLQPAFGDCLKAELKEVDILVW